MKNILLLDHIISEIRKEICVHDHLRQLSNMDAATLEFGLPALLSALLKSLIEQKQTRKSKDQILKFMRFLLVDIASFDFLLKNAEKLNLIFKRLLDLNLHFDAFDILHRFQHIGKLKETPTILEFVVVNLCVSVFDPPSLIRAHLDNLKSLNLEFTTEPAEKNKWKCEIYTGYSCIFPISKLPLFIATYIKYPNVFLRYSPLLDDFDFYEFHSTNLEMVLYLAQYSQSKDILKAILYQYSSDYEDHLLLGGCSNLPMENIRIIEAVFDRRILPFSLFVDLNLFTPQLLQCKEYSNVLINRIVYLARFKLSIEYLWLLVKTFEITDLEPFELEISNLLHDFMATCPQDVYKISNLLHSSITRKHAQERKCSTAVSAYIATFKHNQKKSDEPPPPFSSSIQSILEYFNNVQI